MSRLAQKRYLSRELSGNAFVYKPRKSKSQTLQKTLTKITKYISNSFGKETIVSFGVELEKKGLSKQ